MYQDPHLITNMESHLTRRIDALGKNQDAHFRHIEQLITRASNAECVLIILALIVGILIGRYIF